MQSLQGLMNGQKTIIDMLASCGIKAKLVQTDDSPNKTTYHIDLIDIKQLSNITKCIKCLTALLHKQVTGGFSDIAHFCITIPKDKRTIIKYTDYNIQKALNNCKDLSVLLGVDSQNNVLTTKLEDLPHLLIAGTTGSGKSVLLNNIICGLIQQSKKHNLEIALIDPKQVELADYSKAGFMTATTIEDSIKLLETANALIDLRYKEMQANGYKKASKNSLRTILIIDEFADLMINAKEETQNLIVRIAQLGRACGVHLILATQRPSADIITGLIKSNIPSRIALKTASYRDSMIILDNKGAENLMGKGDALVKLSTDCNIVNIQCPYIDDKMIRKTLKEIK